MAMGYACPVCEIPQQDAEHLAHHLAFTAMLHGDSHETWLDEHTPGWETAEPVSLGEEIAEDVAEAEYKQVFEDTSQSHNHAHEGDADHPGRPFDGATPPSQESRPASDRGVSAETSAVLEEARELTRQMLADDKADGEDETEAGAAESDADSSDDHA
ncbi:MAG: hypothetical protein J07HR59_00945 [Halorubrum sp. J07HR59]|nr:MAG: hypothetical protein J07HR59_00945 [Halorubrum sp. J07HR59]